MSKSSPARVQRRKIKQGKPAAVANLGDHKSALDNLRREVNEVFQSLNQNQVNLGKMFNEQRHAVEHAFVLVDAHQHVSRRVQNDMFWGQVRPSPLHPDDEKTLAENGDFLPTNCQFTKMNGQVIDYDWYFNQYNLHRALVMAFVSLRAFLGLDPSQENDPGELEEESQEAEIEFGGDL